MLEEPCARLLQSRAVELWMSVKEVDVGGEQTPFQSSMKLVGTLSYSDLGRFCDKGASPL